MTEAEVINAIVMRALADVHTMQLGRVEAVNTTTIDVQPVVKTVLNGSSITLPLFKSVPPIFIQGGSSFESTPIAVGDYCLLFVAEACIDRWYMGEDDLEPNEDRRFDYSDSFALVGINPKAASIAIPSRFTKEGDCVQRGNYESYGDRVFDGDRSTAIIKVVTNGPLTIAAGYTITDTNTVKWETVRAYDLESPEDSIKVYCTTSGPIAANIGEINSPDSPDPRILSVTNEAPAILGTVGKYDYTGDITLVGDMEITGTLTVTGDIILNGVSLDDFVKDHTHGGVESGSSDTDAPNPL